MVDSTLLPSMLHEALVELFRHRLRLAPELLREVLGVPVPEFTEVRGESVDFTQIIPTEYRADLVVLLVEGRPVMAIVVEVQLGRDVRKWRSWPVYVTTLRARFDCPTCLLVVTPDAEVARWCAEPIETGHRDFVLRPHVLGPDSVPVVTDEVRAGAAPELAVLSALAHGHEEQGVQVALAAILAAGGLDDERALFYTDLVLSTLPAAARRALEELMRSGTYEYQSDFARKYFGQGVAKGEARGKAESLLTFLTARGLTVTDDARQTVLSCLDPEQLDRWIKRAATVASVQDLFE